jgi:hypothetical protein
MYRVQDGCSSIIYSRERIHYPDLKNEVTYFVDLLSPKRIAQRTVYIEMGGRSAHFESFVL